jgi:hypothetical protein
MNQYVGWYSLAMASRLGSNWYTTPAGGEVEVTLVAQEGANPPSWADTMYVGPVAEWIRKGQRSRYAVRGDDR